MTYYYFIVGRLSLAKIASHLYASEARYGLSAQPVNATHVLNRSAGVSKSSVLRGRSFN